MKTHLRFSGKQFQRLGRAYDYWWHYRTTALGKAFFAGFLITGTVGSASIEMPVFRLFCPMAAILAGALLAGVLLRPRLECHGEVPARGVAGKSIEASIQVRNLSRFGAYHVGAGFFDGAPSLRAVPKETVPMIAAGKVSRISAALLPLRRGLYGPLAVRTFSTLPLNLFRTPCAAPLTGSLLVLPSFHPLVKVELPAGARYQPGGIALTSSVGESPEYIGNREYRPGDPLRRIDFKAWARLGKPAVREYQEEYYCRIALVLDTFVPRGRLAKPEGFPDLEAAVSLCAAIADTLARGEYIIDLFAAGPELYVFRAGRHTAHFENVLELLACADACRTNPFDKVTPALADELASISAVVAVLLDWDEDRERLLRTARECGCSVKAVIVRDGPATRPPDHADFPVLQYSPAEIQSGGIDTL